MSTRPHVSPRFLATALPSAGAAAIPTHAGLMPAIHPRSLCEGPANARPRVSHRFLTTALPIAIAAAIPINAGLVWLFRWAF